MVRLKLTSLVAILTAVVMAGSFRAESDADSAVAIIHLLNRVAFGASPASVEAVRRMGMQRYIEHQLHPERIANEDLTRRLAAFTTLTMSSEEISRKFEQPAVMARRQRQRNAGTTPPELREPRERQMDPALANANLPMIELSQQKVVRAVYSERQLEEVLTDFWFNHFNVDAQKGPVRYMLTEYERDAIRPHVLGRFRDLLEATAKSPAMLFYLDNWMSVDPKAAQQLNERMGMRQQRRGGAARQRPDMTALPVPQAARRTGLNENYGRELLELHTLGVDGGYTQRDVTEVARAFTGWTIEQPRAGGGFRFIARMHDDGEKTVLGHRLRSGGGEKDGAQVLDILAEHPSTARFISRKLAVRFVSDEPPQALVDRLAATFRSTHGDLRAVMTKLLESPEFLAPASRGAKVKTPFEFVVSALRTSGVSDFDARPIVRALQTLGMPPYQCQPPTGYKETADAWINTGALVARMNVAQSLAGGPLRDAIPPAADAATLVNVAVSEATRATIARANTPAQAAALALGSPEFQRK